MESNPASMRGSSVLIWAPTSSETRDASCCTAAGRIGEKTRTRALRPGRNDAHGSNLETATNLHGEVHLVLLSSFQVARRCSYFQTATVTENFHKNLAARRVGD